MALLMIKHLNKKKSNKLSKKVQQLFIQLLADLLGNGFSIQESLAFMKKSQAIPANTVDYLIALLEKGEAFHIGLNQIGFNELTTIQIQFAQTHGDFTGTLKKIKQHQRIMAKQTQNFYKILSYPLLLLIFLTVVLISIRQILLPQLLKNDSVRADNIGIQFIQHSPYYVLFLLIFIIVVWLFIRLLLKRKNPLEQAVFFAQIPIFGLFYKQYSSAFFALEWGKLFSQGLEIKAVIQLMRNSSKSSLMNALAETIEMRSLAGQTFYEQLPSFSFFVPELSLIIQQGELKGNLGKELVVYSELCWQRFFTRMEKMIQWIQPLIFLVVALLIVSVYAAMLLPIYGGMEEFI
ncbi:competence type IV pilus assembly protein ComGB [Enterococcus sp. UD-01]|jgi:competence protein ComGB|uniref:competence type IV pilus assembly protein ComGB n=1 Tax=Enterococcus sp. UD-01 TaxID=3373911 RepID=UPI0038373BF3